METFTVSADILEIDHLWEFTSLTKLQLDNNMIEKIQGLEKLLNLVWLGEFTCLFIFQNLPTSPFKSFATKLETSFHLDLSFNNIEVIEGLDTLVKLQDLSLYNNCISLIKNMDTLEKLQILSLGKNVIAQLDNVSWIM